MMGKLKYYFDESLVGKRFGDLVVLSEGGWYQIKSGNCTGYVKAEFVVTGEAAAELAKIVGRRVAVVNTTTLKVRTEPSIESSE